MAEANHHGQGEHLHHYCSSPAEPKRWTLDRWSPTVESPDPAICAGAGKKGCASIARDATHGDKCTLRSNRDLAGQVPALFGCTAGMGGADTPAIFSMLRSYPWLYPSLRSVDTNAQNQIKCSIPAQGRARKDLKKERLSLRSDSLSRQGQPAKATKTNV